MDLYKIAADGSGREGLLLKSDSDKIPTSWSRDGRFLLYTNLDPKTREDLWVLRNPGQSASDEMPCSFLRTPFRGTNGQFSPEGAWIAYQSDQTGANEIYVRAFPSDQCGYTSSASGPVPISNGGGSVFPRWRGDGMELFFLDQFQEMAVDVSAGKIFQLGTPHRLFSTPPELASNDVAADAKRFLFATQEHTKASTPTLWC